MRRSLAIVMASLVVALSWSGTVLPQSSTGSISGTIIDQNHAAIPSVKVTAKNLATGFIRSVTADDAGRYRLANIPTGAYEITVEALNFRNHVRRGINLEVGQEAVA